MKLGKFEGEYAVRKYNLKKFYKIQDKIRQLEIRNYFNNYHDIEHLFVEQKIEKLRRELYENIFFFWR